MEIGVLNPRWTGTGFPGKPRDSRNSSWNSTSPAFSMPGIRAVAAAPGGEDAEFPGLALDRDWITFIQRTGDSAGFIPSATSKGFQSLRDVIPALPGSRAGAFPGGNFPGGNFPNIPKSLLAQPEGIKAAWPSAVPFIRY